MIERFYATGKRKESIAIVRRGTRFAVGTGRPLLPSRAITNRDGLTVGAGDRVAAIPIGNGSTGHPRLPLGTGTAGTGRKTSDQAKGTFHAGQPPQRGQANEPFAL